MPTYMMKTIHRSVLLVVGSVLCQTLVISLWKASVGKIVAHTGCYCTDVDKDPSVGSSATQIPSVE